MTNMRVLPVAGEPAAEDEDQAQQEQQHAVNEVLAEAGEAGRVAAGWVRGLAARQAEKRHRVVLATAADAVEQAAGREVVPGGDGQLAEELAYDLAAYVVTGSPYTQALPELAVGQRIALVAGLRAGRGEAPHAARRPGTRAARTGRHDGRRRRGRPDRLSEHR